MTWVVVAIAGLAALFAAVSIPKAFLRMVIIACLAGLAIGAYVYRGSLDDCAKTCTCKIAGKAIHLPSPCQAAPGTTAPVVTTVAP
ncbi:MAG: hypothetical protein JWL73_1045 [Actinomycetia bacterium]|nr:hypothetical protein [Actinomycetes bacterium]